MTVEQSILLPAGKRLRITPNAFSEGYFFVKNTGEHSRPPTFFDSGSGEIIVEATNENRHHHFRTSRGVQYSVETVPGDLDARVPVSASEITVGEADEVVTLAPRRHSFYTINTAENFELAFELTSGETESVIFEVVNTGANTITFPNNSHFAGGTPPAGTEDGTDIYCAFTTGDGRIVINQIQADSQTQAE